MREIKFRAWNKNLKKMYKIGQITLEKGTWNYEPDNREYIGMSIPYQPSFVLMQYTGLKDKNEKEIYEGDIIEIKGYSNKGYNTGLVKEIYVVEFKDFCWSCGIKSLLNLATINWASIEVIGNIWEDSDLINDSKNTKTN